MFRFRSSFLLIAATCFVLTANLQCKNDKPDPIEEPPVVSGPYADITNTFGFGIFNKIKGIWNGPVTSSTPLGGYPEWIVDFRPVSENQVSAKNELDSLNDIHMSFFIAKYNNEYRVCFRNGGSFGGQTRVSYFLADSVSENSAQAYYRFKEIIIGKQRAFTEVVFRNDSLLMRSYTNQYNTLSTAVLHMAWSAKLQDTTACAPAVSAFNYPKKTLTRDFSSTFTGFTEAIFYSITGGDPYTEMQQPYLGRTTVNYSYTGSYTPNPAKKVFLLITTQPLISGFSINTANMKFRSRYVILAANDLSYTFNYMHPGSYYLYALYDDDSNGTFSSGDWVSAVNTTFTLGALGNTTAAVQLNFTIP